MLIITRRGRQTQNCFLIDITVQRLQLLFSSFRFCNVYVILWEPPPCNRISHFLIPLTLSHNSPPYSYLPLRNRILRYPVWIPSLQKKMIWYFHRILISPVLLYHEVNNFFPFISKMPGSKRRYGKYEISKLKDTALLIPANTLRCKPLF